MRSRIEMELEDVPGELVKVLQPISRYGANIQNVVHEREEKTPLGMVPVTLILEVEEKVQLEKIVDELEDLGARITRVGEEEASAHAVVLLVGDVIQTDIRDSINRLNSIEGARISELSLNMAKSEEEPSARISIEATSQESLRKAKARLEEISEEKGILVVEPLG